MRGLSLTDIVAHARTQLANAEAILARHQPDRFGLCACSRPLSCPVAAAASLSAAHWRARLNYFEAKLAALHQPTQILPTVVTR